MANVLAKDYLDARGAAFDAREHMDPMLGDRVYAKPLGTGDWITLLCWFAFMAGSDWEREYRGRRYVDETTAVNAATVTVTERFDDAEHGGQP